MRYSKTLQTPQVGNGTAGQQIGQPAPTSTTVLSATGPTDTVVATTLVHATPHSARPSPVALALKPPVLPGSPTRVETTPTLAATVTAAHAHSEAQRLAGLSAMDWRYEFANAANGSDGDSFVRHVEALAQSYTRTECYQLMTSGPKIDRTPGGKRYSRLEMLFQQLLDDDIEKGFIHIAHQNAHRTVTALLHMAGDDTAFIQAIVKAYLAHIDTNIGLLTTYSRCLGAMVEAVAKLEQPARDGLVPLFAPAITRMVEEISIDESPNACAALLQLQRMGAKLDTQALLSAALGPAYVRMRNATDKAPLWTLWKNALCRVVPQHQNVLLRNLSSPTSHGFVDVAELMLRAIQLAHSLGFAVRPNGIDGNLAQDTVAFVAAMISPGQGDFQHFAQQLRDANPSFEPDPSIQGFVDMLVDRIALPVCAAQQHNATPDLLPLRRACALAIAEGRTALHTPASAGNRGYNLLTIGAAATRFERHWHHVSNQVITLSTADRFHPLLEASGEQSVHAWTDAPTGISFREIDSEAIRLRDAAILGHCGGVDAKQRERYHVSQYAAYDEQHALATFDVMLLSNGMQSSPGKSLDVRTRGAGRALWIPIHGGSAIRVTDVGGPGDTKMIPHEVTAAWERFAFFLSQHARIPTNRRYPHKPPPSEKQPMDFTIGRCGYDYIQDAERLRVFQLMVLHPALIGAPEMVPIRRMFQGITQPDGWVLLQE